LATAGATLQIAHEKLAVLVNPEDIKYVTQTNFQNYEIGELRRQVSFYSIFVLFNFVC